MHHVKIYVHVGSYAMSSIDETNQQTKDKNKLGLTGQPLSTDARRMKDIKEKTWDYRELNRPVTGGIHENREISPDEYPELAGDQLRIFLMIKVWWHVIAYYIMCGQDIVGEEVTCFVMMYHFVMIITTYVTAMHSDESWKIPMVKC